MPARVVKNRQTCWLCMQVLRKLRKLAWAENEACLVRVMLKAVKGRFSQVPQVASLASGLARYHPSLGVAFVDALLEEVSEFASSYWSCQQQSVAMFCRLLPTHACTDSPYVGCSPFYHDIHRQWCVYASLQPSCMNVLADLLLESQTVITSSWCGLHVGRMPCVV